MYKEIVDGIFKLLKANPTLDAEIKGWYFGRHDIRKPNTVFPFIDVKWRGGPVEKTKTGSTITRRINNFEIRCIHKHFDEKVAEQVCMDIAEQIETVLDADDTLDSTVESSKIIEVLSDEMAEGGFSTCGARITLRTKK